MKIGQKKARERDFRRLTWLAIVAIIFGAGVALGEGGLFQAAAVAWEDAVAALDVSGGDGDLPTLVVDMSFANYDDILAQREQALTTGVFIGVEADFQPATIRLGDEEIPIRLRLQQGPAQHLGPDDKWNFEGRTRDNALLFEMQRFRLVDPADNNWLSEWAFSAALRRDGLLATRYHFVNLVFNGADLGIYALQEGFGSELMTAQGRTEGVIVEFDASRLWESITYFDGDTEAANADPITNLTASDFQYFEVDTFRDRTIARDEVLSAQKNTAIGLLRSLQSGDLAASEVFDVEKYGRFLALVDLWDASASASLINLRYYYNPESGRLEPIGFNANPLSQNGRLSLAATYNDPALQVAYATAAQSYTDRDYVVGLQSELGAEWESLSQALRGEIDIVPPWETLARRQDMLRRSLNPLQSVFAYLGPPELSIQAVIQVDVANVLNVPVEIAGFDIGGATFMEANAEWIQGDAADLLLPQEDKIVLRAFAPSQTPVLRFVRFHLPLIEIIAVDNELDFLTEPDILVATRILGLERAQLNLARPGYPDPILDPSLLPRSTSND